MQKIFNVKLLSLIFFVFIFWGNKQSFALILPETPDGRIGKNYQLYGFLSAGFGTAEKFLDHSTDYYVCGLRSNLGTDFFDFGIFYDYSDFPGLSADVKYGFIRNNNFSCAIDLSLSKPFMDGFLAKTGAAFNLNILRPLDLVLSSYYVYSFSELQTENEIFFPRGYSVYFYGGFEFHPPFLADNTINFGCGYLYIPDSLPDSRNFFNRLYINIFARYALNEPKFEKKSLISSANIKKDENEEKNINESILLAKELIKIKNYKKAILVLSDTLYYYPDSFMLNLLIADCYYNMGDRKKSYIYYKKASEINAIDLKLKDVINNIEMEIKHEQK
ncbi:MAG: hypothetical protein KA120_01035 [Candidatus Goldbacteria bacterium]|nr:hypothetical protein [Candidatus Goldiibacteriota bacterium]